MSGIKDAVAFEIYSLMHPHFSSLEKRWGDFLVVEFRKGRIHAIKIRDTIESKKDAINIMIPRAGKDFGKRFFNLVRDAIGNSEIKLDENYWKLIANAYDWVWM